MQKKRRRSSLPAFPALLGVVAIVAWPVGLATCCCRDATAASATDAASAAVSSSHQGGWRSSGHLFVCCSASKPGISDLPDAGQTSAGQTSAGQTPANRILSSEASTATVCCAVDCCLDEKRHSDRVLVRRNRSPLPGKPLPHLDALVTPTPVGVWPAPSDPRYRLAQFFTIPSLDASSRCAVLCRWLK